MGLMTKYMEFTISNFKFQAHWVLILLGSNFKISACTFFITRFLYAGVTVPDAREKLTFIVRSFFKI